MSPITDLLAFFLSAILGASAAPLERQVERTFTVAPGSLVSIDISGGSISVTTSTDRAARITLIQRVDVATEREADAALADYTVSFTQQDDKVAVVARRKREVRWRPGSPRVNISAELAVPADVRLDLDTSGGSIVVRGYRNAALDADTSGGSITVDGGSAGINLDTSGGSIRVGRALSVLHADTSGGSITVDHVGAAAREVTLDTSGGSIRVGVAPTARLNIEASTSGGGVSADGLPINVTNMRGRSQLSGTLNGGGGRLHAATSGGSVRITASSE